MGRPRERRRQARTEEQLEQRWEREEEQRDRQRAPKERGHVAKATAVPARRPSGAPPVGVHIVKEAAPMKELGATGLSRWGGSISEEFLTELRGERGRKVYTEMRYNDAVVAAMLRCINWICRSVEWAVEGESDEQVEFVEECREDMSFSWEDFISETLSMLPYGWAYFETVYKWRKGEKGKPASKYDDGRIGWRKFAFRGQNTLWEWAFDDSGGIEGMVQSLEGGKNVLLPIDKCLLFRTSVEKNNPEGEAILRAAYRPWYFKKHLEEIEGIGIERDLCGLPIVYLGDGTTKSGSDSDYANAKQLVRDVRRDEQEGIVIPGKKMTADGSGWLLELLSTGGRRQFDIGAVIARYEKRIAMSMLAQWLMLGMDQVGSYSLSRDQSDFFRQAVEAVLKMITSVLNRYAIPRLMNVNPTLRSKSDEMPEITYTLPIKPDYAAFADAVNKLVAAQVLDPTEQGVRDVVRDVLGLPEEPEDLQPQNQEEPEQPEGGQTPEQMMAAMQAAAGKPAQGQPPEQPQKPMPPEVTAQQQKLQQAAAAMKKEEPFHLYGLEPTEKDDEDAWELSSTPDVIADAVKLAEQAMEQGK